MKQREQNNRYDEIDYLIILLRGVGQVMFQQSAWSGLLFLVGIFWGTWLTDVSYVAWGAVVGLFVSTLTGFVLRLPATEGEQGLWGFNGVLVGCALPALLGNTTAMWLVLVLCAAMTTWLRDGMNRVLAPYRINSLTFPFVASVWIVLLAARAFYHLPPAHLPDPVLPVADAVRRIYPWYDYLGAWVKGFSQVFLVDSTVTGLLFLLGLLWNSRWAALWAGVGSAVGMGVALLMGATTADVVSGLYGYSPLLTAIALATVFHRPTIRSACWAFVGIVATVFVQAAVSVALAPVGVVSLTAPFCVVTWLFLLPRLRMDDRARLPDHSHWEGK